MVKKEIGAIKLARILLRVSSDAQLESDGDLSIQRKLVMDYIAKHPEWKLDKDKPEYFEGSNSGYKNKVKDREILQEILRDAENKKFQILVMYKDDRLGRRLWEIGLFVRTLKELGVSVYTVKDDCIYGDKDDMIDDMLLALRYANAEKSSRDTSMRVKDTARELVRKGRFMGGCAPYGYALEDSGEKSKHGRLLKKLVLCTEKVEIIKYIYDLSLNFEYGSQKIAKILNENEVYRQLAPERENAEGKKERDWRSGTITSILTNPIYSGRVSYNRREKRNGKYRTLESKDWIIAEEANEDIRIIDDDTWNRVQEKRALRASKYTKRLENQNVTVISRNDGMLPLIDIIHCGYCGRKMVNGSKYNYWTIQATGERRTSKIPIYRCQNAHQGVPHDKTTQFRADWIDTIVFRELSDYIERLQESEDIFKLIEQKQDDEKKLKENELAKEQKEIEKLKNRIAVMKGKIPEAIENGYIDVLISEIRTEEKKEQEQIDKINRIKTEIEHTSVSNKEWEEIHQQLPTWKEIFLHADTAQKRVLVDKLIERIDIRKDKINIRFKINLDEFLHSRMSMDGRVQEQRF